MIIFLFILKFASYQFNYFIVLIGSSNAMEQNLIPNLKYSNYQIDNLSISIIFVQINLVKFSIELDIKRRSFYPSQK